MTGEPADRERRDQVEALTEVDERVRAQRRRLQAELRAETERTLQRIHARQPTPAWAGTSETLLEDLQRAAHEARRHALEQRRRVEPIELTREQLDLLRARVGLAADTSPAAALPVISGTLYGVPLRVLPPATPVGTFVGRVDDVLADWHGSPDAVSWHPDGVYPHPIGPRPGPRPAPGLTPEQLERLTTAAASIGETLQRFVVTATEVVQRLMAVVTRVNEASDYALAPPPLPADPRERALELRRRRNTGPAIPPPGARGRRMGS